MATYQVTGPDGHKYRVTGPDGATDEQVLSQIEAYTKQSPAKDEVGIPDSKPMAGAAKERPADDTLGEKLLGVGEAAGSILSGVASPFTTALRYLPGTGQGQKGSFSERMSENVYRPKTQTGQALVKGIGEAGEAMNAFGGEFGGFGGLMRGAAEGSGAARMAAGDAARTVPPAIGSAVAKAAAPVVNQFKVAPELMELAQKANSAGIPVRPDMLTNSRIAKMVGDTLEKVPLSGDMATKRQIAFNRAVIDTIGGDVASERLTPDVYRNAMNTAGEGIGAIAAKHDVPISGQLEMALKGIADGAEFETDSTAKIINKYVKEIRSHADATGKIDGTTFRKLRTQLTGQMRRTNDGDLKHALSTLDEVMLDSVKSQLAPDELEAFNVFRRQYANGKAIEPLVAKGTGDISASKLMARMTATSSGKTAMAKGTGGDLGDIARVGQRFLGEPQLPRNAAYGVLGEIGAGAVAPGTTAGVVGTANVYNRLAPRLAKGMIERSKLKPPSPP
jgi:hypothetical protein